MTHLILPHSQSVYQYFVTAAFLWCLEIWQLLLRFPVFVFYRGKPFQEFSHDVLARLPLLRALPKHVPTTHSLQVRCQFSGYTKQAFLALIKQLATTQETSWDFCFSRVFVNRLHMAHRHKALILLRSQVDKGAARILSTLGSVKLDTFLRRKRTLVMRWIWGNKN